MSIGTNNLYNMNLGSQGKDQSDNDRNNEYSPVSVLRLYIFYRNHQIGIKFKLEGWTYKIRVSQDKGLYHKILVNKKAKIS